MYGHFRVNIGGACVIVKFDNNFSFCFADNSGTTITTESDQIGKQTEPYPHHRRIGHSSSKNAPIVTQQPITLFKNSDSQISSLGLITENAKSISRTQSPLSSLSPSLSVPLSQLQPQLQQPQQPQQQSQLSTPITTTKTKTPSVFDIRQIQATDEDDLLDDDDEEGDDDDDGNDDVGRLFDGDDGDQAGRSSKNDRKIRLGINCYLKNYLKHFYIMCT